MKVFNGTRDNKKKIITIALFTSMVMILLAIVVVLLLKYNVEGETNLPFELKNILLISTADAEENDNPDKRWDLSILQNNDIYLEVKKNNKYRGNEELKNIVIQNIQYDTKPEVGTPCIFKPSKEGDFTYIYTDENKVDDGTLEYTVTGSNNIKNMELASNGGIITFSSCSTNLAQYQSDDDTEIKYDGSLLEKSNISESQLKYRLSFDVVIETVSGKKYKATVSLDLPLDNITKGGTVKKEIKEKDKIIFKRI